MPDPNSVPGMGAVEGRQLDDVLTEIEAVDLALEVLGDASDAERPVRESIRELEREKRLLAEEKLRLESPEPQFTNPYRLPDDQSERAIAARHRMRHEPEPMP